MFQLCFVLLSSVACGCLAGYSGSASGNDIGGNDNFGYGFSGSFSGPGNPPGNFPIPLFDFNSFFRNLQNFQRELQQTGGGIYAYSHASSSPNSNAYASSSITFNNKRILSQAQAAQNIPRTGAAGGGAGAFGGGYSGQSFGGAFSGGFPGGTEFQFIPGPSVDGTFNPSDGAAAFGSIGPDGVQQKASVFPENPNSPNVNVRFGASDTPDGFKSVFTSSSSHTTNVDGKTKTVKQASTTINDNGKVTTYTAKSP